MFLNEQESMLSDVTLLCLRFNLVILKRTGIRDRKRDRNKKVEIVTLPMCPALGLVSYVMLLTTLHFEIRKHELSWPRSQSK